MMLIDIYRYLKRRIDKRPVFLKNFVDQSHHHGFRRSDPSVEIIIPTRDKVDLLRKCVESIFEKTNYENYRVTIIDNQSIEPATHEYLNELRTRGVKILNYPHKFNYSAICNLAARDSDSIYLCFLNNDTEVLSGQWLGSLIDHAVQPQVGVVSLRLQNFDGSTQSLGLIKGHSGIAGHFTDSSGQIVNQAQSCMNVSALSFACALVNKEIFEELGSLDESFATGLNDVEFCERSLAYGLQNIICPRHSLRHVEYGTRAKMLSPKGFFRALKEIIQFLRTSDNWTEDEYFERI